MKMLILAVISNRKIRNEKNEKEFSFESVHERFKGRLIRINHKENWTDSAYNHDNEHAAACEIWIGFVWG